MEKKKEVLRRAAEVVLVIVIMGLLLPFALIFATTSGCALSVARHHNGREIVWEEHTWKSCLRRNHRIYCPINHCCNSGHLQ